MRTLRNFIRSLADLPSGSPADGRRIGLGLDAALKAQRARGAEAGPLTTRTRPAADDRPFTRA
jgi:hypothetical protein